MIMFGYGRWEKIREHAQVTERSVGDVAAVCRAMIAVMLQMEAISITQVPNASIDDAAVPWYFVPIVFFAVAFAVPLVALQVTLGIAL